MRKFIIIIILSLTGQVYAQTNLLKMIRVSRGNCNSPCGYQDGFHDILFDHEVEYNVTDSTFKYRKKPNRKYQTLESDSSFVFADPKLHTSLDSLFDKFEDFKASPGKYFIYRFELVYCKSSTGLPAKIKTMDFWISTNPEKLHPKVIDTVIEQYEKIIYNAP